MFCSFLIRNTQFSRFHARFSKKKYFEAFFRLPVECEPRRVELDFHNFQFFQLDFTIRWNLVCLFWFVRLLLWVFFFSVGVIYVAQRSDWRVFRSRCICLHFIYPHMHINTHIQLHTWARWAHTQISLVVCVSFALSLNRAMVFFFFCRSIRAALSLSYWLQVILYGNFIFIFLFVRLSLLLVLVHFNSCALTQTEPDKLRFKNLFRQ